MTAHPDSFAERAPRSVDATVPLNHVLMIASELLAVGTSRYGRKRDAEQTRPPKSLECEQGHPSYSGKLRQVLIAAPAGQRTS